MISHFEKLQTPLRSIYTYPQLVDQERRFLGAGWTSVSARSLWDLWSDDLFVLPNQRLALNDVEAFDEWEEFVLFASHYFLLRATKTSSSTVASPSFLGHPPDPNHPSVSTPSEVPLTLNCEAFASSHRRRFGALAPLAPNTFGFHGGLGRQARLRDMTVYTVLGMSSSDSVNNAVLDVKRKQIESIEPRMCHTITSGHLGFLLAGGRASPDRAYRDCWLYSEKYWERVEDLPIPLFRHCATSIALENPDGPTDSAFLIYGGKTEKPGAIGAGHVSDQWLLWRKGIGWTTVPVTGDPLEPRFGAVILKTDFRRGILLGGMANDGKILSEAYEWTISGDTLALGISLRYMKSPRPGIRPIIGRMGASLINSKFGILLIGGVSSTLIPQSVEAVRLIQETSSNGQNSIWGWAQVDISITGQRPLLIGHSTFASSNVVAILGGGAVCFSFGTFWNENILSMSDFDHEPKPITEVSPQKPACSPELEYAANVFQPLCLRGGLKDMQVQSSQDFEQIISDGRPVVMRNMAIGPCTTDWTLLNLIAKIGGDRAIAVHETSDESFLDFQAKNFKYVTKPFKEFANEISHGFPQYLRSLSSENPAGKPANIATDFPELASSFELPPQLDLIKPKMHSSVLRISGRVTVWLHYDVMANVLCQIRGAKRLLLYPPSDVSLFSIPPGSSSSCINCFDTGPKRHPSLTLAHPQEALLRPGDILFIPPLWLHTASPVDDISISVNIFFRNIDSGYAPGRDVYGNRDLQAYEKGRRDIEKISRSFDKLPRDMGRFYLDRLADELKERAQQHGS